MILFEFIFAMAKRLLSTKRTISVDVDGTIADISARLAEAEKRAKKGTEKYWNILLDGELYHLDKPIQGAKTFLLRWVKDGRGEVVYLSGRRAGTEKATRAWLELHGFPAGSIIHRVKGSDSRYFKTYQLKDLRETCRLVAHFGDRPDDDGGAARDADVRFFHIRENDGSSWPSLSQVLDLSGMPDRT